MREEIYLVACEIVAFALPAFARVRDVNSPSDARWR